MSLISRKQFLEQLESVLLGVSDSSSIEQSDCFAFSKGIVSTYNYEVACFSQTDVDIDGCVLAHPLLKLLGKLENDEIEIYEDESELKIAAGSKSAGIRLIKDILLPVDTVEVPASFFPLDEQWRNMLLVVADCCSKSEAEPLLRCVHITPDFLEASDNIRIMRCSIKSPLNDSIIIKGEVVKSILNSHVPEMGITSNWVHFKRENGSRVACRRMLDQYPDTSKFLEIRGNSLVLPKDLEKAVERAVVFWSENHNEELVQVELGKNVMTVEGSGSYGWYRETSETVYDGPEFRFYCAARVLKELSRKTTECEISDQLLRMEGENIVYVSRIAQGKRNGDNV